MSPMFTVLSVLFVIDCAVLITVILLQKKRAGGLSGSISGAGAAGGDSTSTYWDKNKSRSLEGKLELYTKVAACLFFFLAFLFAFIR